MATLKDVDWVSKLAEKYVRTDEVAHYLGSSLSFVRKKIHDPESPIPHHRFPGGRGVRFRLTEVDAWFEGVVDVHPS